MPPTDRKALEFAWARPVGSFLGLLVAYYAFPVELGDSLALEAGSLLLTSAGLGLLAKTMIDELNRLRRGQEGLGAPALSILLVLLVMSFALAFFLLNLVDPDQFVGLETRTDALYFTLTTMATVGFGDVHAAGQLARAMVSVFIVFNIVVVASLVRAYTTKGRRAIEERT